jgi:hypothetical protein
MYEWDEADAKKLLAFCHVLGIEDYTVPLHVWASESNNDPCAHNPSGNASGVCQLLPSTLSGLGYPIGNDPDLSVFRRLTVAQQLSWAVQFYQPASGRISSVASFYTWNFLPAQLSLAGDPDATLCSAAGPYADAYLGNCSAFDNGMKGWITPADLVSRAVSQYGPRARSIANLVGMLNGTGPCLPPTP